MTFFGRLDKEMYRGNTFLRLMRCFKCMIIEDEPNEPSSQKKTSVESPIRRAEVYLEPPGRVEPNEVMSSDSEDDWVIAN